MIKDNLLYFLILTVIITLFYCFKVWEVYPIYGGEFLSDWNYIATYYECTFSVTCENTYPFIYPKIWFNFYNFFKNDFNLVIYPFIIFYLFSSIYFFQNSKKIIHFFLLFSPHSILAIQRGNNEIIIYFFLFVFLIFLNNRNEILSLITLSIASILKLYPLILAVIYLLENKNNKWIRILLFLSVFILGIFLLNDILYIQKYIVPNVLLTYSSSVLLKLLSFFIKFSYFDLIFYLISFFFIIFIYIKLLRFELKFPTNYQHENSFLIGSLILSASFFLSTSFDYRLIFVVFTFPYISEFLELNFKKKIIKTFIIFILIFFWMEFIIFYYYDFIDFTKNKSSFGYIVNFQNIILGSLMILKNIFYWILNIGLIFISINIILKKQDFLRFK